MTLPDPVFRGAYVLDNRRISGGRFFHRPDPAINHGIKFALAYFSTKYLISLIAHASLSNHGHNVFHDPHGNHPEFRRDYYSILTRSFNVLRGTRGAQWAPDEQCPTVILDTEALLDAIAYTIANPETHGLVEWAAWPGVLSKIEQLAGEPEAVTKPDWFYDPNGDIPDTALLQYRKPPELQDWSVDEYRSEVARRVEERCDKAREKRGGKKLLGRVAILAQSPTGTPSEELPSRTRNPRVKCRSTTLRIAYLLWLSWFRKEHRDARLAFEAGDQEAKFPFGTYWHVLRYGVNCSSVGPPGFESLT